MAETVNIDFETGTIETLFTNSDTDGGHMSIEVTAGLAGTGKGLQCNIQDATPMNGIARFNKSATVRWRIYIHTHSLTMAEGNGFGFQALLQRGPTYYNTIAASTLDKEADGYYIYTSYYKDDTTSVSDNKKITDGEHYLEFEEVQSSGELANDGTFQWWVDGEDQGTATGIDNYNLMTDPTYFAIEVGAYYGIDSPGTSGTFFIDEIIANDDGGEIGPVEGIGPVTWYSYALAKAFGSTQAAGVPSFDWLSDTIKVALLSSLYVPSQDTHTFFSEVDSCEITGSGYTAGGATLDGKTITVTTETKLDANDAVWTPSTITARYAVIYKAGTAANSSPLLGYVDFGANQVTSQGTFTITWPTDGIFAMIPD